LVGRLFSPVVEDPLLRVAQPRFHERRLYAYRPVLTQRPFLTFSELQLWEDGVSTTSRHLHFIDGAVRESTRLVMRFRDSVVRHRLNEHTKKLDYYTGNYDSYVRERSIRDDEQQRKYDAEQRDIAEIKDFIARLPAASRESRPNALEIGNETTHVIVRWPRVASTPLHTQVRPRHRQDGETSPIAREITTKEVGGGVNREAAKGRRVGLLVPGPGRVADSGIDDPGRLLCVSEQRTVVPQPRLRNRLAVTDSASGPERRGQDDLREADDW